MANLARELEQLQTPGSGTPRKVKKVSRFARFPSEALPRAAAELAGNELLVFMAYINACDNWDRPATSTQISIALGKRIEPGNVRTLAIKLQEKGWMRHGGENAKTPTHPDGTGYEFAYIDFVPRWHDEALPPKKKRRRRKGEHALPATRAPEREHALPATQEDACPDTRARPSLLITSRTKPDLPTDPPPFTDSKRASSSVGGLESVLVLRVQEHFEKRDRGCIDLPILKIGIELVRKHAANAGATLTDDDVSRYFSEVAAEKSIWENRCFEHCSAHCKTHVRNPWGVSISAHRVAAFVRKMKAPLERLEQSENQYSRGTRREQLQRGAEGAAAIAEWKAQRKAQR